MQDRTLTIVKDDGTEVICDILFTYHYDKTGKDYVVFQVRDSGDVSAAVYNPTKNGEGSLDKVETDEEWEMLEDLLADYSQGMEDDEEGGCAGCAGCGGDCGGCSGDCGCK